MNDSYTYSKLTDGEGRLVILSPGLQEAPLQCFLTTFSLDTPPPYEALSYTWGEPFCEQLYSGSRAKRELPARWLDPVSESALIEGQLSLLQRCRQHIINTPERFQGPSNDGDAIISEQPIRLQPQHVLIGREHLPLHMNLEKALRHLRLPDQARTLWVDALCINQADDCERAQQVSQMDRIYDSATSVCIWLGEAWESSDDAFHFIKDLWTLRRIEKDQQDWREFIKEFAPYGHLTSRVASQLRALSYLVNREWFYRRWVVQEVAFAQDIVVQCGHSKASWSQFAYAVTFLNDHHRKLTYILRTYHIYGDVFDWTQDFTTETRTETYAVPDIRARAAAQFVFITRGVLRRDRELRTATRLVDISTPVTRLCDLRISDLHDTVYALYSLARDTAGQIDLFPDYSKTLCEVFVDLVRHTIASTTSLDIVLRPWVPIVMHPAEKPSTEVQEEVPSLDRGLAEKDDLDNHESASDSLPSWLCIASSGNRIGAMFQDDSTSSIDDQDSHQNSLYAASGTSQPLYEITGQDSRYKLQVRGFIIGAIENVSEVARDGILPIESSSALLWSHCTRSNSAWRVLVGGKTSTGCHPPSSYQTTCWALFNGYDSEHGPETTFLEALESYGADTHDTIRVDGIDLTELIDVYYGSTRNESSLPKDFLATLPQTEDTVAFLERMRVCTWNRRLIKTSTGRWGLAPAEAAIGDTICILFGCSLPVVLRRKRTLRRRPRYEVIGSAYIHGSSDGEAMQEWKDGLHVLRDFELF